MENKPASFSSDPRPEEHYNIRIARDGTWFYNGSPIERLNLVKLFSSVLRRDEQGDYWLITPAERGRIDVEDAPFVAVELKSEGEGQARSLAFRLNTGDLIVAGPDHPLQLREGEDGPHPYLTVRSGLEALIARPVYYELANLALAEGAEPAGLWSEGVFFRLDGQP